MKKIFNTIFQALAVCLISTAVSCSDDIKIGSLDISALVFTQLLRNLTS